MKRLTIKEQLAAFVLAAIIIVCSIWLIGLIQNDLYLTEYGGSHGFPQWYSNNQYGDVGTGSMGV